VVTVKATKATKAANGEGSIRELVREGVGTGKWWARMTLPDGRRKAFYGHSRAEVHAKLTAALADQHKGRVIITDRSTVATYLSAWLDGARGEVRDSTWRRRKELVAHVTPTLGRVKLTALTAAQIRGLYAHLRTTGLSSSSVHRVHSVLHLALRTAEQDGLVARNEVGLVKAPRENEYHHTVLDGEQIATFRAAAARDEQWGALWEMLITCGLRIGEALALTWREANLSGAQPSVRVVASMERDAEGKWVPVSPKTKAGRRTILLLPEVASALTFHHARQKALRLANGSAWEEHGLVFPNRLGRPMDATHLLRRSFKPFLQRAGLPPIRLHDLRHTCATWLIARGTPIPTVAQMLGHADASTTMRVYAHALPTGQERALTAWDDLPVAR
jgi:integrase